MFYILFIDLLLIKIDDFKINLIIYSEYRAPPLLLAILL